MGGHAEGMSFEPVLVGLDREGAHQSHVGLSIGKMRTTRVPPDLLVQASKHTDAFEVLMMLAGRR
jgi:hypothetical protein